MISPTTAQPIFGQLVFAWCVLLPQEGPSKPDQNAASFILPRVVLQYELCMGKHPFSAQNEGALIRKIMRGDYERPSGYSRELLSVVMACLSYDHKSRPSAAALLARPPVSKKAHDLHILPLAAARRPSLPQPAMAQAMPTHTDPAQATPKNSERGALAEMPAMNQVQEKHPVAREDSAVKVIVHDNLSTVPRQPPFITRETPRSMQVEHPRATDSVDKMILERPVETEQMHPNIQDNVQHLMQMSLSTSASRHKTGRLAPAELPPAGARCNRTHDSAPYAKDGAGWQNQGTGCDGSLWTHQYERPQYARKRSQDLMVTGPNPRTAGPTPGRQVKAAGYYAYEASVNTSTSYMRGSHS